MEQNMTPINNVIPPVLNRSREELLSELMYVKSKLYRIQRILDEFRATDSKTLNDAARELGTIIGEPE
jgi:hypothetical protein